MDEGSESYMNFQSERGADKSGGERVVEPISLLERRIYVVHPKSVSSFLLLAVLEAYLGPSSGHLPLPVQDQLP